MDNRAYEYLPSMVKLLDGYSICMGHPDEKNCELAKFRKGVFKDSSSKMVKASLDATPFISTHRYYKEAIRTTKCDILVSSGRSIHCKAYIDQSSVPLSKKQRVSRHRVGRQLLAQSAGDTSQLHRGKKEQKAVQRRYAVAIIASSYPIVDESGKSHQ